MVITSYKDSLAGASLSHIQSWRQKAGVWESPWSSQSMRSCNTGIRVFRRGPDSSLRSSIEEIDSFQNGSVEIHRALKMGFDGT